MSFALAAVGYGLPALFGGAGFLVAGLTVAALGIGAIFVTAFTASLGDAEPAEAGLRSAIVNTFHELGGAAGVAVLSSVAGTALVVARPAADAFSGAFTVGAAAALASGLAAALVVPRARRLPTDARPMH
ncbi:hypothetical protein [Pseudofrankia sp. BMG5.36]|uniref:hypothetical protein n=1 Tax=Pseudofrankia sp. BMG5.36 TaxID=1834512 RepID=UPI0018E2F92C|nr:hypothetical protein [Pseudofrankia sp. BMG5.36]